METETGPIRPRSLSFARNLARLHRYYQKLAA
jgi:hypothetical protein